MVASGMKICLPDLAHRYLKRSRYRERHWNSLERQITTSPLSITLQVAMAEAGKIGKSLASMGRRTAQTKARQ
jgi:hypothetical protein